MSRPSLRVYIVEDEALIALLFEELLRKLGHEFCGCSARGERAVEEIARLQPDVVLMDVNLRGSMSGLEAAQQVRALTPARVIFVTADSHRLEREPLARGVPLLSKPFTRQSLALALEGASAGPMA